MNSHLSTPKGVLGNFAYLRNVKRNFLGGNFIKRETFLKYSKNTPAILILFVVLISYSCASYIAKGGNVFDDLPFDEIVWKQNVGNWGTKNDRGKMVESLQSILEDNKFNKQETIELLGKPEETYISDYYGEERDILLYSIGWWTGYGIDPDTFDVAFDMSGNYIGNFVHQH